MSYIPGEDAELLRGVVREFLADVADEAEVRRLMATDAGFDPAVWRRVAEELGLQGLALPEGFGGSDATLVELGVVFEEMGRALFCAPFLATVGLAAVALVESGDAEAQKEYLPRIAAGEIVATLAGGEPSAEGAGLVSSRSDGGWSLSGEAPVVVDGGSADLVLVVVDGPDGTTLFAVDGDAAGLTRTALPTLDQTRKLARLTFDGVCARSVGEVGGAAGAVARTRDTAALLLAAEQLGGSARVLETAVAYARDRVQFGRAIGSFQAVKHRCADMLTDVESARSVVYHGLWTAVHEPAQLATAAMLARSVAADVYNRVAAQNVQIHGGIGFTWEHSAHLYLKRAKSSQLLLGRPAAHRARLAGLLGITAENVAGPESVDSALVESSASDLTSEIDSVVEDFLARHPVATTDDRALREARFDEGLAVVGFDEDFGGRGLDSSLQPRVETLFAAAGAEDWVERNVIGLGMALPTIHEHGTEAQRARYLRPCFTGEEIWCQLFSEPGAGSDLAALATRAVRDGDDFVVNGQKVWTSLGHVAQFGILLARTDPDVPKHKGLTFFVLDMSTPGVDVRPLRQLTGEAEFNEVYLSDVRIPAENVLGEVGGGWAVAMTTLANERVSLGGRVAARGSGPIEQAVRVYREAWARGEVDAATTERLMLLWTAAEAARLSNVRAAAQVGRQPGPEGSIAKLQMAELNKAIYEFCVDLSGSEGLLIDDYTETRPSFTSVHGGADVRKAYLRSLANSIEGGTSEVLRNILGERVLGLPGEPRVDRDIPWREVRRS